MAKSENADRIKLEIVDHLKTTEERFGKIDRVTLCRYIRRGKYRRVSGYLYSEYVMIPQQLHGDALSDMRRNADVSHMFKITTFHKSNHMHSKHFDYKNRAIKNCDDCKNTGWYVGMVERYPCPTCQGDKT